jgi:hypothetical protein
MVEGLVVREEPGKSGTLRRLKRRRRSLKRSVQLAIQNERYGLARRIAKGKKVS